MRDPKRINNIINLIRRIWKKSPDLRLCQLLGNCYKGIQDLYYKEDEELEQKLKEFYKDLL